MLRFFLFLIGFAFGWSIYEWPSALILGAIGGIIGHLIDSQNRSKPPAASNTAGAPLSLHQQLIQLQNRVQRLEQEVQALRTGQASSDAPSEVSASETIRPAVVSPSLISSTPITTSVTETTTTPTITTPATPATPATPRPQPRPTTITTPSQPDVLEELFCKAKAWLLGGNTVVRVGILILFFGVGFLLKYAADNSMLPIEYRLTGLALGAMALLVIGWRLRSKKSDYALILQGGGIGVLYMTIFGALKLYQLLPAGLALGLLVAIGIFSATLAILQNARSLAVMGIIGGFLAPILTSTGGGNHVMLFSYYAILNSGIFGMAWFKAWRPLNLLGFVFTFSIATFWGALSYHPDLLASTLPFLILFFLFYVGISVLYALRQSCEIKSPVDGTLVFGTPMVCFALQAKLMQGIEYGLAYSAVLMALFYLGLGLFLIRQHNPRLKLILESLLALGIIFATLAIPLAFDGKVSAAIWALEGAGVVWVSLRQQRRLALSFGLVLQFLAGLGFLANNHHDAITPILNGNYIGSLMLALAGLFCGWQLHKVRNDFWLRYQDTLHSAGWILATWGLLWWVGGNANEIQYFIDWPQRNLAFVVLAVITSGVFSVIWQRGWWLAARWPTQALPIVLALLALDPSSFFLNNLIWPIAIAVNYWLLHRHDDEEQSILSETLHLISLWLIMGIFAHDFNLLVLKHIPEGVWSLTAWPLALSAAIFLLLKLGDLWPVADYRRVYWGIGPLPVCAFLYLWGIYSAQADGNMAPLPYLPLLNPIDIMQWLTLGILALWLVRIKDEWPDFAWPNTLIFAATGGTIFVWLNAVLLRTLHHTQHIAYQIDALADSMLVQMSLTIFWTLIALALMLAATRRIERALWLVGAALLGVVVVKLFIFDLSRISGIERIIAFIGVGVLLLLIGYFSPLPPRDVAPSEE
ncbi:DUF2339 domain-containing protein [Deefgea rivuli]|uniref:DUF2339 domain-containing protein n=1 Tax=Deefgea rivuli TaxID=400948 RepID=UPI0004801925|nr:DUF2339 domain-containing protein [Deefgea rivuli]